MVLANAGAFGGDASNVAIVGESAGGNLAANVAIAARDTRVTMPKHMVLIYLSGGRKRHEYEIASAERRREAAQQTNDGMVREACL
jgi:acetyl esterase/lipase